MKNPRYTARGAVPLAAMVALAAAAPPGAHVAAQTELRNNVAEIQVRTPSARVMAVEIALPTARWGTTSSCRATRCMRSSDAAWSPDGPRIAHQKTMGGWHWIYRVWAYGTGDVRLPNRTGSGDLPPHWR